MSLRAQDQNDPLAELARLIGGLSNGEPAVIADCVDDEIEPPSVPDWANVMRFLGGAERDDRPRAPDLGAYIPRIDDAFYPRSWFDMAVGGGTTMSHLRALRARANC